MLSRLNAMTPTAARLLESRSAAVDDGMSPAERISGARRVRFDGMVAKIVEHRDVDGSGTLNVDEMGLPQKIFDRIDANGDGETNVAEMVDFLSGGPEGLRVPGPRPSGPGEMGQGSKDDETDESSETVSLLDADGDGQVDVEEVTTALRNIYEVTTTRLRALTPTDQIYL
jgi:hypothetical protein